MALTAQQEQQLIEILGYKSQLLDLGSDATEIEAALGYGDVRVIDLPTANPLATSDVMYIAQSGVDVKATVQQFSKFVYDTYVAPALASALAAQQTEINNALDPANSYFIGQS